MRVSAQDRAHILERTEDLWPEIEGQKLFITGGTGFVGLWLLEALTQAYDELEVHLEVVLLSRDPDRFRARAPEIANHSAIHLLRGNATDFPFPDGHYHYIIHAATEPQTPPTPERPCSMFDTDVAATRRVLEFARSHGTRRLLFTGSGAAYGKQPPELTHLLEDHLGGPSTTDPHAAYGHAKRVAEWLCLMHARQYGFDVLLPRLFAFVGPYLPLDRNFAIGNFIRDVLVGHSIQINGDGSPYRSYLYGADLAIWLLTLLVRGETGRIYNVGSPHALTISDLATQVVQSTDPDTQIHIAQSPVPGASPSRYVPGTVRAETELGLDVWIDLPEAIRRTYNWYRDRSVQ